MKLFSLIGMSLFLSVSFAKMAMSDMIPATKITITSYLKYFDDLKKSRELTELENERLNLASFANEIFGIDAINSYANDASGIDSRSIIQEISIRMGKHSNWNEALSKDKESKIAQKKGVLKKSFGENSLEWAWVLNQLGEKESAKEILLSNYEESYKSTMELTEIFGDNGIQRPQLIYSALEPMCSKEEKAELDRKMKKMKIHVSNLPDAQILT